jgi:predicted GNAT family acetyltransferase
VVNNDRSKHIDVRHHFIRETCRGQGFQAGLRPHCHQPC